MPYAIKPNLNENDPNKDQGQNGINISGGGGADFSTGIPGQESTSAKPQKSSGNYANISSYLDANRDQGDQMGQNIASNVEAKAQDAQGKIQSLDAKAPEVKAYDPNETYSKLGSLTDQEKTDYRNTRQTGGYSGPQTVDQIEGYNDTQKAANEAAGLVKSSANEYGQQALLKDTYKRPDYTAGQNRLDQVLLQGSQGSKQALEGLSQKYSGLDNLFNTTSQKVGDSINKANQQALANKNNIQQAEADQWKNLVDPIQARADEANRVNPELVNRVVSDVSDDTLSQETLDRLGLSEGANLYNLNLSNYLKPDLTSSNLDNTANSEERHKYQLLNNLFQDPTRNQINADGKQLDPVNFNKEQFEKDLSSGKQTYLKKYSGPEAERGILGTGNHPAAQFNINSPTYKLNEKTPEELEKIWIPYFKEQSRIYDADRIAKGSAPFSITVDALQSKLNSWKSKYQPDRKVKKG